MENGSGLAAQIETRERERTGIPKLRVGYNKVFGYYIEITNAYKDQAPSDYIRKQTLTNCERFITPELKSWKAVSLARAIAPSRWSTRCSMRCARKRQPSWPGFRKRPLPWHRLTCCSRLRRFPLRRGMSGRRSIWKGGLISGGPSPCCGKAVGCSLCAE